MKIRKKENKEKWKKERRIKKMEERKKKEERGNRKKEKAIKEKPRNKMTNNIIIANLVFICPRRNELQWTHEK